MICPNCGKEISDGLTLCPACGAEVSDRKKAPPLIPYRKGKKWGFCDSGKKMVLPTVFDGAYPHSEGIAQVRSGDGELGYIDSKGTQYWED